MLAYQSSLFALGSPTVDHDVPVRRTWLDDTTWIDRADAWLVGADALLLDLDGSLTWRGGRRPMYGRLVDEPRLHATLSPADIEGRPVLGAISRDLEARYGAGLSPGFVNYYRDGRDSVAWHGDRIGRHEVDPVVAIVSLGGPRRFGLRPRTGGQAHRLVLHSGDLLVMGGACQHTWEHCVPKMRSASPRMSLSYRHVPDGPVGTWWPTTPATGATVR